jgi:drug/metabolite transporter (DMT)-like permease
VNLLWAAQYPAYKIASDHMGVATLNFWVLLLASAILAPLVIRQRRSVPRGTRVWFEFGMLALLGIIPPSVLLAWGVAHSSGANAAILSMTIPVLMSIMGVMMLGERLTIIRIVSLFLALVGTLLISRSDLAGSSFRSDLLLGNAVIFLAGAGSAFYNAYAKRLLDKFTEAEILLYGYLTAIVPCAIIAVAAGEHPFYDVRAFPLSAWLAVICLGGLSWGFAMVLWMWVLNRIEVSQASVSVYMLSIFGVILSTIMLHERLGLVQLLGGLVVVVATLFATEFDHRTNQRKRDSLSDETRS